MKAGTTVTIFTGTTVELDGGQNNFSIEPNGQLINNGTIVLGDSITLFETPGFPITGTGKETTTRNYTSALSNENIGGLGAELSTTTAPGIITITRTHENYYDSLQNPGIKRSFRFVSASGSLNATLKFRYDTTELNGLGESGLIMYESPDNGMNWVAGGGTADPFLNQVNLANIDSLGFYTLFMTNITSSGISSNHCEDEQFQIYVDAPDGLEINNDFVVQLSDINGSFISPVVIGTFQNNVSGNIPVTIPSGTAGGVDYRIRVVSTNPVLFGVPSQPFEIKNMPGTPSPILGITQVCNDGASVYYTSGASNADSYNWYLSLAAAGVIQSSADSVVITWDTAFTGNVLLEATGINSCGEGPSTSISINVNYCVGLTDNQVKSITVLPNPATDHIFINGNKNQYDRYIIYTIKGEKYSEGIIKENVQMVDLAGASLGIYYINIAGNQHFRTEKFIIR